MSRKNALLKGPWRIEPEVLRTELNDFFGQPELTPGLPNWEANMPRNTEVQSIAPRLPMVNKINDTWMEIPRYEDIWWGAGWFVTVVMLISSVIIFLWQYLYSTIFFLIHYSF